ncbi:HD-GYP domain-containing protein [Paenibacillus aceris]|uniref:HD-GYP domain-containing protein (C-di-GMP phosphodiesterase class II) n=1 Tax=Paenibacillus aceris TaxID=869555 RepID=A0ABS4I399_9BACL|nr:HD domain-containing phosphohydrolase [Paenibacillus aceris]MBP1964644.1 HD-GYP domain-containing protein (c-di-GMP phosphodiesterase class II) [Paenibacillus aceris]NHW33633.1 HD domain-containing protein [Paenibacillus aceris]
MKYVHLDSVESGQYLGRTIFASNGSILLSEGVQLTVFMINTLKRIGVTMIYIKDPNMEDVEIPEIVSNETKRIVMQRMGQTFAAIQSGKEFDTRAMSISINTLLDEVMKNRDVLVQLTDIRTKDNEMYVHATNVCMMAVLIGINMGFNATQLKELAVGALLHDVGKVELTYDDESSDRKRHHTWRGFELLKTKREFSLLIAHVAFQHHEALDGMGIPRGLTSDEIHIYAKITAVANMYDNLLFDTSVGRRMLPYEACEHMMALAGTKLDREVLIHFLKTISIYPTGASVRLSNRQTGVVVGQHRGLPSRPIVRIVKQDQADRELDIKEIDLAKHTTVFIEQIL